MRLRRLDDAAEVQRLAERVFADPGARTFTGYDEHEREERMVALWVDRFHRDWRVFAVEAGDEDVGLCGVANPDEGRRATVALYLLVRGKGLGKQVVAALVDEARELGATHVHAVTNEENAASRRVFEANGFALVGPSREEWTFDSEHRWVDYQLGLE